MVEHRQDGKYAVIFFGTLETANVNPSDIWPYTTHHSTKFCTKRNLAKPLFMEGMEKMKHHQEKESREVSNSLEEDQADLVTVGRSKSRGAAGNFLSSSKGIKRKLGAEHKVSLLCFYLLSFKA